MGAENACYAGGESLLEQQASTLYSSRLFFLCLDHLYSDRLGLKHFSLVRDPGGANGKGAFFDRYKRVGIGVGDRDLTVNDPDSLTRGRAQPLERAQVRELRLRQIPGPGDGNSIEELLAHPHLSGIHRGIDLNLLG